MGETPINFEHGDRVEFTDPKTGRLREGTVWYPESDLTRPGEIFIRPEGAESGRAVPIRLGCIESRTSAEEQAQQLVEREQTA